MRPMMTRRIRHLSAAAAVAAGVLVGGWTFDHQGGDQEDLCARTEVECTETEIGRVRMDTSASLEQADGILSTYEACLMFSDMPARECLDRFGR